jgi:endo-1,4-beta-xylanase
MKNTLILIGFLVIAVIITFALTRCGKSSDEDNPSNGKVPSTPGTSSAPTVTSVTISPATVSVTKGKTQTFTAKIAGTNNPAQTVTWSIVQTNKNSGTTINSSGVLTVAAAETLTSLTVKATSTADTSKSGTASVTITGAGTGTGGGDIFNGETLTSSSKEQETRKSEGYDFELWNQNKQGTASMTLGSGGAFKCSWSGIENVLFRAGRKFDKTKTHSQIGVFSIDYNAPVFSITKDVGYLSVYGWVTGGTPDALIEYYIVESRGNYNPGSSGTNKGTVTIDGGTYTIYETTRTNQPSIEGNKTFKQYWSIRNSNRTNGIISVSDHFKAWADKGLTSIDNGKLYEVSLKVEGYQNNGSAEITKNILSIGGVPIN